MLVVERLELGHLLLHRGLEGVSRHWDGQRDALGILYTNVEDVVSLRCTSSPMEIQKLSKLSDTHYTWVDPLEPVSCALRFRLATFQAVVKIKQGLPDRI